MLDSGGSGLVPARLSRSRAEGPAAEYQDGVIAVDGKTLRRSSADASERQPPHPARASTGGTRPDPMQTTVYGKPDEITAIPALLKLLDFQGRTAAADAMHAQRAVSEAVNGSGGGDVTVLKGNQGKLRGDMKRYMENPGSIENIQFSETHKEKEHGRVETRQAAVRHDAGWLEKTGSLVSSLSDPSRRPGKSGESAVLTPVFHHERKAGSEAFSQGRSVMPGRSGTICTSLSMSR